MFSVRLQNNLRPIGLDIGHRYVKMIQLQVSGGRVSVIAASKAPINVVDSDDPDVRRNAVIEAVRQMLAEGAFHGHNVVSHLDNQTVKITSLRLPESGDAHLRLALAEEVSERFALDPEKDMINYLHAGSVRQHDEMKSELIVLAAADEAIRNHIDLLSELQLKPVSIDSIPTALFRSFRRSLRRAADRERSAIFVDVGAAFTTVVFGRAGEINFIKQIRIGVDNFNAEIADRLEITPEQAETLRAKLRKEKSNEIVAVSRDDADAIVEESSKLDPGTRQAIVDSVSSVADKLAQEISLCLRYYTVTFRGKRVEKASVAGGGAYESILLNVLKRKLAVEVDMAYPLRGFDTSAKGVDPELLSDRTSALSEWSVAAGLSLKGSADNFTPASDPQTSEETTAVRV